MQDTIFKHEISIHSIFKFFFNVQTRPIKMIDSNCQTCEKSIKSLYLEFVVDTLPN